MSQDCTQCVHYAAEADIAGKIPQCTKYGYPLGISPVDAESTRSTLAQRFAHGCMDFTTNHAHPREDRVPFPTVGAAPLNMAAVTPRPSLGVAPTSCKNCQHYIPPAIVKSELGFEVGMCSLGAELLPPKALLSRPRDCVFGVDGENRTSTDGVMLNPKYDVMTAMASAKRRPEIHEAYDPHHHTKTDPRDWVSERDVTEEDRLDGIRAWRKVAHPRGTRAPLFMPIFDWKALGIDRDPRESYGSHQPHLYVDHAALLHQFAFLYMGGGLVPDQAALKMTLALVGEAGTGKTEFWAWVAWLMDLPFKRISIRPSTAPDEFFGSLKLVIDEATGLQVTKFEPGRFTTAFASPCVVCLDEPNSASDDLWFLLRPALDSAAQLVIESESMVIEKDAYCFVGLAMNPDENPVYRGARPLSGADFNRLRQRKVDLPDAATERGIIRQHCLEIGYELPDHILSVIMNVSDTLRTLYADGAITVPWGIRSNIAVAQLTWGLEIEESYQLAITDGLEQAQAETIISEVRAATE